MRNRRAFQRYHVTLAEGLKAHLIEPRAELSLAQLGEGGCAFVGQADTAKLVPPCHLKIEFQQEGRPPQQVEGTLIYVLPRSVGLKFQLLYGIKFRRPQTEEMAPLFSHLENLAARGQIAVDRLEPY